MIKMPRVRAATAAATLAGLLLLAGSPASLAPAQEATPSPAAETPAAGSDASGAAGSEAADGATAPVEDGAGPAAVETLPAAPPTPEPRPDESLVVVSWGGVYAKSQEEAVLLPFSRETGMQIESEVYSGGLDRLREQAAAGNVVWDVVDVDPADAAAGCAEGLFEKLSLVLAAAPDGTDPTEDFLPGTIHPCAVGSLAWSMVMANKRADTDAETAAAAPDSLADFFDLAAFPGGRGLRRTPMANLEWALMADGVPPSEVYAQLRTEAGVERAFAKLDTIKGAIVWWEDAAEPARLLASGAVAMTSTYNAPMFNDIAVRQRPFALIWDGQIWDIDLWAIPAAAPSRETALEFLRFATSSEALARQTRWIPYGPVRRSSAALVEGHFLAAGEIASFLPTAPENLGTALRNDAVFWRDQGPALVDRFNAWLAR